MWTRNFVNYSLCLVMVSAVILYTGCERKPGKSSQQTSMEAIKKVQEKHQQQLMSIPGVVGVGIGAVDDDLVIKVLVERKSPQLEKKIPKNLEGFPVVIEETGRFRALPEK